MNVAPVNINQITYLAEKTGLKHWAFGECFSFGLPFFRIVSGNAIISRYPIEPILNMDLHGRKPFYITKNTRRALACNLILPDGKETVWSLHNDSFNLKNNLLQVQQILNTPESLETFMAGDFNAKPTTPSMLTFREAERFNGVFDGPFTFPAQNPNRTIDFVLSPSNYTVLNHHVITNSASDHCAVITRFEKQL